MSLLFYFFMGQYKKVEIRNKTNKRRRTEGKR